MLVIKTTDLAQTAHPWTQPLQLPGDSESRTSASERAQGGGIESQVHSQNGVEVEHISVFAAASARPGRVWCDIRGAFIQKSINGLRYLGCKDCNKHNAKNGKGRCLHLTNGGWDKDKLRVRCKDLDESV